MSIASDFKQRQTASNSVHSSKSYDNTYRHTDTQTRQTYNNPILALGIDKL